MKMSVSNVFSSEDVENYNENGFVVLKSFASLQECMDMKIRMQEIVTDWDPKETSVFTTKQQARKTGDHFLDSAATISFFLEENTKDENGNLKLAKELSINKAGHALHTEDSVFKAFVQSAKVKEVVKKLGYVSPSLVQSMYIFKQPNIGGEVCPHQDSTFLLTDPPSTLGMWVALDDATLENGCLWGKPGSHKNGVYDHFTRNPNPNWKEDGQDKMIMKPLGNVPNPDLADCPFVPLIMKAGDAVFLHGAFEHRSYENRSSTPRHSFQLHLVEGPAGGCTWSTGNWLQYPKGLSFPEFENY
eukprot:CFRG1371T1